MIRFLVLAGILVAGLWWLISLLLANSGDTFITWDGQIYAITTATLVFSVLVLGLLFSLVLWFLLQILGLGKRFRRMHHTRLSGKASQGLTQGLIQLAEGHWDKAERLLTEHVDYSDTPLLNYLTAARAAHMQQNTEQRDEWLRKAIESDGKAQVAVGVSQAEMQMGNEQWEQAHATLLNLRSLAPNNSYVLKMHAKTLYQQQNWDELLDLLPELLSHKLLEDKSQRMQMIQAATLKGSFNHYATRKDTDKLQTLWGKIPSSIREQPATTRLYAHALRQGGENDTLCARFIEDSNNREWDEELADLYGRLEHDNLQQAAEQAGKWLARHPDNPTSLLLLARLNRRQKLWGMAKSYYETSLNQAPNAEGYLELAELLETMNKPENARQCYRLGLRYAILRKAERLA